MLTAQHPKIPLAGDNRAFSNPWTPAVRGFPTVVQSGFKKKVQITRGKAHGAS